MNHIVVIIARKMTTMQRNLINPGLFRSADGLNLKSLALIYSIVMQLCEENKVQPPDWAKVNLELDEPWFISKFKGLWAICLAQSPLFFCEIIFLPVMTF